MRSSGLPELRILLARSFSATRLFVCDFVWTRIIRDPAGQVTRVGDLPIYRHDRVPTSQGIDRIG